MHCAVTEVEASRINDNAERVDSSARGNVRTGARPILWWRGGKSSMMDALRQARPKEFTRYLDPFAGGLSHFLDISSSDGIRGKAVLSDANEELIRTYKAVAQSPEAVLAAASRRLKAHSGKVFRSTKAERRDSLDDIETAARMIYLNKTSYNALYRVDNQGRFSCGMGYDRIGAKLKIDADNLMAVSRILREAELRCSDFCSVVAVARAGDFCLLDPPYPGTCCEYTRLGFTDGDHRRLHDVCIELDRVGTRWLQTNSDCRLIRELYRGYRIVNAQVYRRSGNPSGSRLANEVIITNY